MREFLILSATELEQSMLARLLQSPVSQTISGKRWITGTRGNATVRLVVGGLGAVNTAHALSCALQGWKPDLVLQLGGARRTPVAEHQRIPDDAVGVEDAVNRPRACGHEKCTQDQVQAYAAECESKIHYNCCRPSLDK